MLEQLIYLSVVYRLIPVPGVGVVSDIALQFFSINHDIDVIKINLCLTVKVYYMLITAAFVRLFLLEC